MVSLQLSKPKGSGGAPKMKLSDRSSVTRKIQRNVGFMLLVLSLLIIILNVSILMGDGDFSFFNSLIQLTVFPFIIWFFIGLISILLNNAVIKFLQALLFLLSGLLGSVVAANGTLVGPFLFLYGMILLIQFGFLKKHFLLKSGTIIVLYSLITVLVITLLREKEVSNGYFSEILIEGLITIVLACIFLFLFYTAFAEEIKEKRKENYLLHKEYDKNKIFIDFGRNVAGIVHNIKSSLMAINGYAELLQDDNDKIIHEYAGYQLESSDRILNLVNRLSFATRSYQEVEKTVLSLNLIIVTTIEVIQTNLELKNVGKFLIELDENDRIFASPLEIFQLIDNILKNAHEAMINNSQGRITVKSTKRLDGLLFIVEDEGIGIPWCSDKGRIDCLKNSGFAIGKTTKQHGSGLGMIYIIDLVKAFKGKMYIESEINKGTTVEILFPSEITQKNVVEDIVQNLE